jgi:hypothetical protein
LLLDERSEIPTLIERAADLAVLSTYCAIREPLRALARRLTIERWDLCQVLDTRIASRITSLVAFPRRPRSWPG